MAHCPECAHELECKNCEVLRELLVEERFEKKQLLNRIIELTTNKPVEEREKAAAVEFKPIGSKHVSWKIKQALLEDEDRAKARLMQELKLDKSMTTEELEKELLGVENASGQ